MKSALLVWIVLCLVTGHVCRTRQNRIDDNELDQLEDDDEQSRDDDDMDQDELDEVEEDDDVTKEMKDAIAEEEDKMDFMRERLRQFQDQQEQQKVGHFCDPCLQNIVAVGCYKDKHIHHKRPLPRLLDNHRVTKGRPDNDKEVIDWGDYERSLQSLVCHCAIKTRESKHTIFGLQFYGECFSGENHAQSYKRDGKAKTCIDGSFQQCNSSSDRFCVGEGFTNYVYRLEPLPHPHIRYEKVGCFKDMVHNRALRTLLVNHRDKVNEHFKNFNWVQYRATLQRLLQDCVKVARQRGYKMVGLQYYGECWSGEASEKTYNKHGASSQCENARFKKCDPIRDCNCVGKGYTNFVYRLL